MPNTPARLGKGVTVWYATPETTEDQRAQAAALLGALGLQLEVDDEKMVAMATAVSGTGPTYVFLVMEALIDAAVHLGFPRHVAHDLVIETLEGSTSSPSNPACTRPSCGTWSRARGHIGRGAARAGERPPPDRDVRGRLGGVPANRELGDQLESSLDVPAKEGPRNAMTTHAHATADLRRATLADARALICVAPGATCGRTRPPLGSPPRDLGRPRRRGLAPPRRSAFGRGRARLVARGAHRPHRRLAGARRGLHPGGDRTGRWPSDDDYDGGDFDRYNERRRAPWTTMSAEAILGRLAAPARAVLAAAQHLAPETIRGHEAWGWVYFVLHGHYLDHLAVVEPWTDGLRLRQVDGDPFVADPRAPTIRASARRRPRSARSSTRSSGPSRPRAGAKRSPRAGPSRITSAIWRTGRRRASAPSRPSTPGDLAGRSGRRHRRLE